VGLSVSSHDEYLAGKKSDLNFWQSRRPNPYNSLYPSLSLFREKETAVWRWKETPVNFHFHHERAKREI